MDRLTVRLAIWRGRRLYHGEPFLVFALDLRDPLGACLTGLLHAIGDASSVAEVRRRADRFERAPLVTVPSSLGRARTLLLPRLDWTPDMQAQEGCTFGDMDAVRAFILSDRPTGEEVPVLVVTEDERSVFHVAYPARGPRAIALPVAEPTLTSTWDDPT